MNIASFRPVTGMHPITAAHLDGLLQHHTEQEDLCFWPCQYGYNEVVFEGFVKCDGGVRHLVHRYEKVTLHEAALDILEHGTFSPRPYRLAQACDGSINECVLALFVNFCAANHHSADALFRASYPDDRQIPHWREVVIAADWQGVCYPSRWDADASAGLLESLHVINYHQLAALVAEAS
ncbi:MAG: hypothetical protein L0Z50_40920 [Verrucomicrobiales bacterium]|nr:hypothetical protein [Verrucomicrobiales bacterium]